MLDHDQNKGFIFDIQKFSIHDGEGIRTLVFMKGCPLNCIWCSNPESQFRGVTIMDVRGNCIECRKCVAKCPLGAIDSETMEIDRAICDGCGKCCHTCYANAKKIVGQWVAIEDVMKIIEKDRLFYRNSGGGVTIGGGEPLIQISFVKNVLRRCLQTNIHTAIETCGYGEWEKIKEVFLLVDQVMYDIKHMDNQKHRELTGVGNELILKNAEALANMGKDITFRIPLISGYNDSERNIQMTGAFIRKISRNNQNIKVEILPLHHLGADKYGWIGQSYRMVDLPVPENKEKYNVILEKCGCNVV